MSSVLYESGLTGRSPCEQGLAAHIWPQPKDKYDNNRERHQKKWQEMRKQIAGDAGTSCRQRKKARYLLM